MVSFWTLSPSRLFAFFFSLSSSFPAAEFLSWWSECLDLKLFGVCLFQPGLCSYRGRTFYLGVNIAHFYLVHYTPIQLRS